MKRFEVRHGSEVYVSRRAWAKAHGIPTNAMSWCNQRLREGIRPERVLALHNQRINAPQHEEKPRGLSKEALAELHPGKLPPIPKLQRVRKLHMPGNTFKYGDVAVELPDDIAAHVWAWLQQYME